MCLELHLIDFTTSTLLQLRSQTEEKRILKETLRKIDKNIYASMYPEGGTEDKNSRSSTQCIKDATLTEKLQQNLTKSSSEHKKAGTHS